MSIEIIGFIFGCLLLFIGVVGGGIEVKEIKVPKISNVMRVISVILGIVFLIVAGFGKGNIPSRGTIDVNEDIDSRNIISKENRLEEKLDIESKSRIEIARQKKFVEMQLKNEEEEKALVEEKKRKVESELQKTKEEKDRILEQLHMKQENTNQPIYSAICWIDNNILLITFDGVVLNPKIGYKPVAKTINVDSNYCAFAILPFAKNVELQVEYNGNVYCMDKQVGFCMPYD